MTTAEDFTTLAEGREIALEGSVRRCPRCGRNGIEQKEEGAISWVHVQKSEMLGDGLLIEPADCCPVPSGRR